MKYQFRPYATMQPTVVALTGKVYEKGEHPLYTEHKIIEVIDEQGEIHYVFEDELKPDEVEKQELEILEVPMPIYKQETTSEGFHRIYNSMDFTEFDFVSFKIGVEWQMERSYSEEDMRASLANLSLINPAHLIMTSDGYGEFPDGYKLTEKGISYIIEQLNKK